jgi:cytochrome c
MQKRPDSQLLTGIGQSLLKNEEAKRYGYQLMGLDEPVKKSILRGATIFKSLCAACHGPEGQGLATQVAPPLISKLNSLSRRMG